MADDVEALFANLRGSPFIESVNAIPQELGDRGGVIPQGWLADNSVTTDVIQAGSIIAGKIAAGSITANEIAANTITSNEIAANTITAGDIAASTITGDRLAANTITGSKIAADAITTNELAANAVETENVLAANITAGKIVATITGKKYGASNGTAGAPGFFFDSDGDTGFVGGADNFMAVCSGSEVFRFTGAANENFSENLLSPGTDNSYSLGRSAFRWTEVWAVDGTINTSDARLKQDVSDVPLGLDFIQALRPVVYRWKETHDTQAQEQARAGYDEAALEQRLAPIRQRIKDTQRELDNYKPSDPRAITLAEQVKAGYAELHETRNAVIAPLREVRHQKRPGRRLHMGLLAQDVKAALDAAGVDVAAWKVSTDGTQSLAYTELIAPLIKAVQELAGRIATLEAQT